VTQRRNFPSQNNDDLVSAYSCKKEKKIFRGEGRQRSEGSISLFLQFSLESEGKSRAKRCHITKEGGKQESTKEETAAEAHTERGTRGRNVKAGGKLGGRGEESNLRTSP